jgi:alpha-mannosidase
MEQHSGTDQLSGEKPLTGRLGKRISRLKKAAMSGLWSERALWQTEYAYRLSLADGNEYDTLVDEVLTFLENCLTQEGAITKASALKAEKQLSALSERAKQNTMLCCAHAHLDINWLWGWDETVAAAIDTFKTMLELMKEVPDFTFSQSQGALYHVIAQHHPEMIEEIKRYVHEGRWELTASSWVEADKNLPSGESLVRQILYSKRYISALFDVPEESMKVCFEPDTFGHTGTLPEILASAGVKYYYHCRGTFEGPIYRWKAPSGSNVLTHRDTFWYNNFISPEYVMYVPEHCKQNRIHSMLKIYGVGNHGGGPTRGDLMRFREMSEWPVFPKLQFGTFTEYFEALEEQRNDWPEVKGELNFIFPGAYTSQSRIKMANRLGEAALEDAERLLSMARLATGLAIEPAYLEGAWRNVLLTQFHDILPGTCIAEVKDHALGLFQETMAIAASARTRALRAIADNIDTTELIGDSDEVIHSLAHSFNYKGQGAGAGFKVNDFQISQYEQGWGTKRIYHVFNPSLYERSELVEVVVWDWPGDVDRMVFTDSSGNRLQHQLVSVEETKYWGHSYRRIFLPVRIPSAGYATYLLSEDETLPYRLLGVPEDNARVMPSSALVLENKHLCVELSAKSGTISRMIDKQSGLSLFDEASGGALFRLVHETADGAAN